MAMINPFQVSKPRANIDKALASEEYKRQLLAAELLGKTAGSTDPVYSPTLGIAKLASGALSGWLDKKAETDEETKQGNMWKGLGDSIPSIFGLDTAAAPAAPAAPASPASPAPRPDGGTTVAAGAALDPVAQDLAPHQRAFLNAVAGPESDGKYNIRYTPKGGAEFAGFDQHPGIFEPGPAGPSSAAGRYQFTKTTWDRMGGGDFSPENQDRRAWQLGQDDYKRKTGRDLDTDLQANGFTPQIASALGSTWAGFKDNPSKAVRAYQSSIARYGQPQPTQMADLPSPEASPVEQPGSGQGFAVPPAAVQSIEGDDPAKLRADAEAYAKSNPEAARQLLARADAAEAAQGPALAATPGPLPVPPGSSQPVPPMNAQTFDAIQSGGMQPAFQAEGPAQPWMGTALPGGQQGVPPAALAQAIQGAPMPPPRPANLGNAPVAPPGAAWASGTGGLMPQQAAPPVQPPMPDLTSMDSGGAREFAVAEGQRRLGQPSGAGITNPLAAAVMGGGSPPAAAPAAPIPPAAPITPPMPAAQPGGPMPIAPAQPGAGVPPQALAQAVAPPAASPSGQASPAALAQARAILSDPKVPTAVKQMVLGRMQEMAKPTPYGFQVVGDQMYRTNPRDGSVAPVGVEKPVAPVSVAPGSRLVNPRDGKVVYDGGSGFKNLTSPEERAAAGIPPEDKRPFQVGPDGKLSSPAGGQTINVDTKGAGKFAEKANEIQAKRYGDMVESSDGARQMQGDLDMLDNLMKGVTTGRGAEARLGIAQFAKAWGFDDIASSLTGGKLGEMEAVTSIIDKLTPQMRQGMPGAASDRDVAIFRNALPSMVKTPDGNQIVMGTLRSMNDYKMQQGEIASQVMRGEMSQADADKAIKGLASPFAKFKEYRAAAEEQAKPDRAALEAEARRRGLIK